MKWQGNFANLHPLTFAAEIARRALAERKISPTAFDALVLGLTVPAKQSFYGAPWLAGLIGAPGLTGPTINQACATSVRALALAGITINEVKAIKTHNPFAVNDVCFAREFGLKVEAMNNYGSSLVWGHPQGPTGMWLIIELIEELVLLGGGYGLFTGCAAGDSAAAVVVKVGS